MVINTSNDGHPADPEKQSKTSIIVDREEYVPEADQSSAAICTSSWIAISLVVFSLALSMFLLGLDSTIVSTAIPEITNKFHALDDVGWYASAYMLTFCAIQLIWGKLYSFWSAKSVYLAALFIFEVGSLLCGVAPSSTAFIVGRAIAGAGSGGVSAGSFVLVAHRVPLRHRAYVVGIVSAAFGVGSIAGPLVGGAFTTNAQLTWRWCFYINLPLGLFVALVIFVCIRLIKNAPNADIDQPQPFPQSPMKEKIRQMDFPGFRYFSLWGGTKYIWSSGRIVALLVLGPVLLLAFASIQMFTKVQSHVTVPMRVVQNRKIWASSMYGSCIIAAFFTMMYYLPIWFQAIKGASPVRSGIMTLPTIISFVIFSTSGGALTSLAGCHAPFACLSVVLTATGSGLLSTLEVQTGTGKWIGYQILFGAGSGLGILTALTPAQALPVADIAIGTAIIMFCQNLMGSIMVSVAQNVFTNELVRYLAEEVDGIDAQAVLSMGATEISDHVPSDQYGTVLKAYNKALTHTFYVAVACLLQPW
ncbi:uncharacterized protein N7518_009870 [Penicillium psychrosexuale]|uniref:uncharacterized protein n=1 Tax=Penicillium psychrosexuale TaxID=1002107 RepID=UPI0025456F49|nr:uncharacterized protein N7518_009870 [Penicillium psychrosexuale]KAJ5781387.1 hypothetical protein N7518_009870 [Penicillium psychrosexuale]